MPEGPSLLYIRDQLLPFQGKIVKKAGGYGKMPKRWIKGKKLQEILTWGKHLLFVFANGTVKIHLGLFGDILVNERKKVNRSFYLEFSNGEINGYVARAEKLEKPLKDLYDWRTDILSPQFSKAWVKKLLETKADKLIADVLVDQGIFTGSGNIIRNEVLYRAGIHPLSVTGKIPPARITKLLSETVKYARVFYQAIQNDSVGKTFRVYQKKYDPDGSEVTMKILPKSKRKIFFSEYRQKLYT